MYAGAIEEASLWLVNTRFQMNPLTLILVVAGFQWVWNRRTGKR